jgi:uncharacterized GH25 family protein
MRRTLLAVAVLAAVGVAIEMRGDDDSPRSFIADAAASPHAGAVTRSAPALPVGHRITGRTVDTHRQPIAGAAVTLDGATTVVSDDTGAFAFDLAGSRLAAVKGPAYGERYVSDDNTLELEIGPSVVVHVVDRAGAPIAGALIDTPSCQASTGVDGIARLRTVDPLLSSFFVSARGFVSRQNALSAGNDPASVVDVKVVLAPAVPFAGTVVDEHDRPVPGAEIYARTDGLVYWVEFAKSDNKGHFAIDDFGPGWIDLQASTAVDVPVPTARFVLGSTPRRDVVLHVERGAIVSGIAVDASGHPVRRAEISVAPGGSTHTGDDGRFSLPGIRPGSVTVDAHAGTLGTPTQTVAIPRRGHVEARLVMTDSVIAGTILSDRGHPVVDATVTATGPDGDVMRHDARTDAAGAFVVAGLPPGTYKIEALREVEEAEWTKPQLAHTGARDLAIVMPDVARIRGRVLQDGKPVEFFGVTARSRAVPQYARDGRFILDGVSLGTASVTIVGPTFARRVIDHIAVRDDDLDLGDIDVTAGRRLRGSVVDAAGMPVAGASVVVQHGALNTSIVALTDHVSEARGARTDATGHFELVGLPADISDLLVQAAQPDRGLAVPRPLIDDVVLVLGATGSLTGTVIDEPDGPIGHEVHVVSLSDAHSYMTTTSAGRFAIDQLVPDNYEVWLDDLGPATTFHVGAHETATVALERL